MELIQLKSNKKLNIKDLEKWRLGRLFKIIDLDIKQYCHGKVKHKIFWTNNYDNLEYIYYDAKEAYLNSIKKYHPDKNNGLDKNNTAKNINIAWRRIKKIFAQHGIINGEKTTIKIKRKHEKFILDIINLYTDKKYSMRKISKLFNIPNDTIKTILVENLIFVRGGFIKKCVG